MQNNPRKLGDRHVSLVHKALNLSLNNYSITDYPKTVRDTVEYIFNLYPNIFSVTSKFETKNTNIAKDLTLYLDDGSTKYINLFLIKKGGRIQTKNLGAKSFFSKYFLSHSVQEQFNQKFEKHYLEFLKSLVRLKRGTIRNHNIKGLKKDISNYFPSFTSEIEPYRNLFLYNLREACFSLLKDSYNDRNKGFDHAYHTLFMTEDTTIITRYGKYESMVSVERFNPSAPYFNTIELYKSGKNSVGIKYGEIALTLRFKFESGPTSSIKLAVSYDTYPSEAVNEAVNKTTVRKMKMLINDHKYQTSKNQSNAIGKCHEAITYYYFLQYYPDISQVDPDECINLLDTYFNRVNPKVFNELVNTTSTIVPAIREQLYEKYLDFEIESIELVPESYVKDRLDTGDLKIILRIGKEYEVESISLKATAKKSNTLTTKNPGIGTILGPTYFNIGDLTPTVTAVKEKFSSGKIDHRKSLEILAKELGTQLDSASQDQLKQGIENLLGKAMMAVTFYKENSSVCKEHSEITSVVKVGIQNPSSIQNKLTWNDNTESINLRVKFSKSQSYGWSSVKLASQYLLSD